MENLSSENLKALREQKNKEKENEIKTEEVKEEELRDKEEKEILRIVTEKKDFEVEHGSKKSRYSERSSSLVSEQKELKGDAKKTMSEASSEEKNMIKKNIGGARETVFGKTIDRLKEIVKGKKELLGEKDDISNIEGKIQELNRKIEDFENRPVERLREKLQDKVNAV